MYQAAGDQYFVQHGLPPPVATANTLPRDITAFTGRSEELERLVAMAAQLVTAKQTIPIVAIDGMPGVGKTTFAVHVAHRLSPRFPDGNLFVDMYAHTPGKVPVEPADALFSLLSVDGARAAEIPDDVDGRSALWRARMAGRRAVLLIDNVVGYQQVEPLLPGAAGCLVLVTSRRRLTGLGVRHGAAAVPLHPLAPGPAANLFARLAGRPTRDGQESAVRELVRLCGGLPLAISLLAARLRPEPQWRVQTLLDELATARDRLAHMRAEEIQVVAAFNLSYRCLPSARRRFFRLLGLSPGTDIDAYAAAALAGVSLATARRHLDALYDDHLVDQPVQGRYRLHDLLAEYARVLLAKDPPPQRELAMGRLLDYYQHTAGVADQHLTPRPDSALGPPVRPPMVVPPLADSARAVAWMETELPNLLACATYATTHGDDARLVGMFAGLAAFLRRAGPYGQTVAFHRAVADAAGRRGDPASRAAALYHLGMLLGRTGNYSAVIEVLNEARALHRELGDQAGEAVVVTAAGVMRRLAGDYAAAAELFADAAARLHDLADPSGQADALVGLAATRWLADDYPAAIQLLDQALALQRQAGNRQGQANVLFHQGAVRRLTHDYPVATLALQQAMALYRRLGARTGIAPTQLVLGAVRRLSGDHLGAARYLDEALRVYEEVGDRLGQANVLVEQGILLRQTNDYTGATRALRQALSHYQALGNRRSQAEALQELGEVRRLTRETSQAADELTEALSIYQELGSRVGQAEVLNYLGALLLDQSDAQALDRFQTALRFARQVQNPLAEARALEGIASCAQRHQTTSKDTGRAIRHLREALKIYRRIGAPDAERVMASLASLDGSL